MERPTWQGTKSSFQLTAFKELNMINNHMSLKENPSTVELSDEMPALVDT